METGDLSRWCGICVQNCASVFKTVCSCLCVLLLPICFKVLEVYSVTPLICVCVCVFDFIVHLSLYSCSQTLCTGVSGHIQA